MRVVDLSSHLINPRFEGIIRFGKSTLLGVAVMP